MRAPDGPDAPDDPRHPGTRWSQPGHCVRNVRFATVIGARGRALGVVVGVGVAGLALAGCTADPDPAPTTSAAAPAASATATPTPTPTSTGSQIAGTLVDLSDPDLGIVFEDVPDVSGDEADVYNWASTYKVEMWRAMTTNTVSPAFSVFTSPEVQGVIEAMVAENTQVQASIGGTFHVSFIQLAVDGDTATATSCDDYAAVTFTDADGPDTPDEAGFGEVRRVVLSMVRNPAGEGLWTVQQATRDGSC